MLCPTPDAVFCDAERRPYFLWDVDLSLEEFEALLADPATRPYWLAALLRQAKPDDVYRFVSLPELAAEWPGLAPGVGKQRPFWEWRIRRWREHGE